MSTRVVTLIITNASVSLAMNTKRRTCAAPRARKQMRVSRRAAKLRRVGGGGGDSRDAIWTRESSSGRRGAFAKRCAKLRAIARSRDADRRFRPCVARKSKERNREGKTLVKRASTRMGREGRPARSPNFGRRTHGPVFVDEIAQETPLLLLLLADFIASVRFERR